MASHKASASELLVNYSRLSLYLALALLVALGTYAVLVLAFPNSSAAAMGHRLFVLLPILVVISLAALRSSLHGVRPHPRNAAMRALRKDELRAHSLSRAYRNGLIAVLLAQPLLVFVLSAVALPYPLVPMAGATLLVGVATVLCSLLAYDR
ncbi:MAG: hypothetical protein V4484_23410 [Pseudomonadota bacterium]